MYLCGLILLFEWILKGVLKYSGSDVQYSSGCDLRGEPAASCAVSSLPSIDLCFKRCLKQTIYKEMLIMFFEK